MTHLPFFRGVGPRVTLCGLSEMGRPIVAEWPTCLYCRRLRAALLQQQPSVARAS